VRIAFSRNRAAQLDLLLRSLLKNTSPEHVHVIWWATGSDYFDAYYDEKLFITGPPPTPPAEFHKRLVTLLEGTSHRLVTFFCDDDVVFRPLIASPSYWLRHPRVLCFSWRLSAQNNPWRWAELPRTDHGYPGSIDGHTFRVTDVLDMIYRHGEIENPTAFETVLAKACEGMAEHRPLMAAPTQQVLVGVPVNRVSDTSGCPYGDHYPQTTKALNDRFLSGQRIDLDALDFSGVRRCHHEIPFVWSPAAVAA
jgi:hypothetical protein